MTMRALSSFLATALLTAAAPSMKSPTPPMHASAPSTKPPTPPSYGRIRYADSLRSVNDRCVVSHAPLNLRIDPVYVNGQPVGFC